MVRKTDAPRQAGFTLLEIVIVLVVLGVLAAVAAGKYFDLQELARYKAAEAVAAEAQAIIHGRFAQALLEGKSCAEARNYAKAFFTPTESSFGAVPLGEWLVFADTANIESATGSTPLYVQHPVWNWNNLRDGGYTTTITFPLCAGESDDAQQ